MSILDRIQSSLSRFVEQPDKVLHVAVGFALATVAAVWLSDLGVLGLVGLVAWGKERYDKAHADVHTFDGWDAFATVAGGWFGLLAWRLGAVVV